MAKKSTNIYQIKITLEGAKPPIWRRILVPGNTTLLKLHDILQIVMGWENCHLHMFMIEGMIYGDPEDNDYGEFGNEDEKNYKLCQVILREGQRFNYEYDFGDSWNHTLLVEKILSQQDGIHYPCCLKGKRACPPEDVGGVWGYEKFLEVIRNPADDEHEEYIEWVNGEFDPEEFNLEEVNSLLRGMSRGRSTESLDTWSLNNHEIVEKNINLISPWSQTLPDELRVLTEELPLRRDVIALLTYLRDNKVTGTQSTGNFPLKAVHEICARFVNPPKLEAMIGEAVYRVRSEFDVWPLYFRHLLVSVGGLVKGG